jgi:hypothetical protein
MNVSATETEESYQYPVGTVLKYTYSLQVPEAVEDIEGMIEYSNSTLTVNDFQLTQTNGVISNINYKKSDGTTVIYFCGTSYNNPYDFTEKTVLCTAEFTVKAKGETYADLNLQYMNGSDKTGNNGTHYVNNGVKLVDFDMDTSVEVSFEQVLKISSVSLSLFSNLQIDYYMKKSLFTSEGFENPYVVFDFCGKTYEVEDYKVTDDYYVFTFKNIAPHKMTDIVTSTPYATLNGQEYKGKSVDYSVEKYCYASLSRYTDDSYASFRTLIVDLLNYGADSQIYKNYNTDDLVNSSLTEEQKAMGTTENPQLKSVANSKYAVIDNPEVTYSSVALMLTDSVAITLYAKAEDVEGLTLKAVMGDKQWSIPASDFNVNGDVVEINFDKLNSAQMSKEVLFTFYRGDTAVSNTLCYSIESYVFKQQNNTDTKLMNLIMSMMKYGNSASAYVA